MPASGARCMGTRASIEFELVPRQSSFARPSKPRSSPLNAVVVQAVTAALEGLQNLVFITEGRWHDARLRVHGNHTTAGTLFRDSRDMGSLH
jgi:hypothetical protein